MAKIADVQEVSLEKLRPYERNAKKHGAGQIEKLKASILEFGFLTPCLIDSDYNLIAGHGRVMAAKELGIQTVPCVFIEGLSDEQRRAYILADNRLGELGEWDIETVSEELSDLRALNFDITLTGFNVDDILFDEFEDEPLPVDETRDEPEIVIRRGEIWRLGRHRLMCGDSTNAEDVAKLMGDETADLLETDPPYGVALGVGDTPEIAKKRNRKTDGLKIENDALDLSDLRAFLSSAFRNASDHMKPGAVYYCWYASTSQKTFQEALEDAGMPPHEILIWVKNSLSLGRHDYQWRHEPCFYGWRGGAGHYFIDLRSLTTVQEADLENKEKPELVKLLRDVLDNFGTVFHEDKPNRNELHPTMKPVGLIKKQIRNSSREGEIVLDLFGGSGTTLMAAEEMNRRCFMMEYDERYASAIIRRWEKATGQEGMRIYD